jgi:hypothetical protein
MAWIKISDDNGGIYAERPDPDPVQVVSIAELEAQIASIRATIPIVTDTYLLEWAKARYPFQDDINYINEMNRQIAEIQILIDTLKAA